MASSISSSLAYPPDQCDGYPPPVLPAFKHPGQQVNFYVPKPDDGRLACSLIRTHGDDIMSFKSKKIDVVSDKGDSFKLDTKRPVMILCHGTFSWRNQMLFSNLSYGLTNELDCHTIRFDFNGNGHSSGPFCYGGHEAEKQDLYTLIQFVESRLQCSVVCLIGHSKGHYSVVHRAWEQDEEDGEKADVEKMSSIPCFVSMSGRYCVPNTYDPESDFSTSEVMRLEIQGQIVVGRRGNKNLYMTLEDLEERQKMLDSTKAVNVKAPVLVIHGTSDDVVPVKCASLYDDALPNSRLFILKGANHNFNGLKHIETLVKEISDFVKPFVK